MYARYGKRTLDIITAIGALAVFIIPILLLIPFARRDTQGSGIIKQLRFGRNRQPFTLYKIRTMHVSAPERSTNDFKDSKSYISRFGKIVRKLSLDELPQLFNVIRGDMSIVGPRPVILKETGLIDLREQVGANNVKPGITGWAQVNGRDELSDVVKSRMDGEYVKSLSFMMDMKCLLLTVAAVLAIKGHREGHEMEASDTGVADADNENVDTTALGESGLMVDKV